MNDIKKTEDIARAVRTRRKELGLTQADAAGLCGVGIRFWSELENGKKTLQLGKVLAVLDRLGIVLQAGERQ
jgi:y4mF family transcriptional regulator